MRVGSPGFFAFIGGSKAIKTPRDTLGEFSSVPRSFLFQGVSEGEKEEKAMAQVIAAPTTEEMTRVATVGVGAGFTGAVEGVIVSMGPKFGALELPFTWGALLGVPAAGAAAALITKGILSDLALGIAAGGAAILGYTLPALAQEFTLARGQGGGRQLGAGPGVKLLGRGAAQRAQQAPTRSLSWQPEAIR